MGQSLVDQQGASTPRCTLRAHCALHRSTVEAHLSPPRGHRHQHQHLQAGASPLRVVKPRSVCHFETHQGCLCPSWVPKATPELHFLTAWAPSTRAAGQLPRSCLLPGTGVTCCVGDPLAESPASKSRGPSSCPGSTHRAQTLPGAAISKDGDLVARRPAAALLGYLANQETTEQADALGLSIPSCPPGLSSASSLQQVQGQHGDQGTATEILPRDMQGHTGSHARKHT